MLGRDLHIAFSVDDAYLPGMVVSANSVRASLRDPGTRITFHVIDGGLSPAGRDHAREDLGDLGHVELYDVPDLVSSPYRRKYITTPAQGRLHLGSVIPTEVSRMVYLDADTLVLEDLTQLSRTDLAAGGLGAVSYEWSPHRSVVLAETATERQHGAAPPGYFNSGVLVIDMDVWRAAETTRRAVHLFRRYRSALHSADQDILNVLYAGRWTSLPARWNRLISAPDSGHFGADRLDFLTRREGIVHYVGAIKPWMSAFPGLAIVALGGAVSLLGDGLADLLNPARKR